MIPGQWSAETPRHEGWYWIFKPTAFQPLDLAQVDNDGIYLMGSEVRFEFDEFPGYLWQMMVPPLLPAEIERQSRR